MTPAEIAKNQQIALEAHKLGFIGAQTLAECQKFLSLGERTAISSDDFFLQLAGLEKSQLRLVQRDRDYLRSLPEFTPHLRIVRELSRGGMGVVYQAWSERFQRVVAVKEILPSAFSGAERQRLLSRFGSEARAMAAISHPGTVSVHEAAVSPTGSPYIVMDYVAGNSLAGVLADLREGVLVRDSLVVGKSRPRAAEPLRLEIDRCVDWGVAIAEGLHACHLQGVMHRDVKPSNILINEQGQPKLADFGVALSEVSERVTKTGEAVGTPLYMAPECLLGKRRGSDPHPTSDIYSLGVTLYEALTGSLPYKAGSLRQFYVQVYSGALRAPRELRSDIPEALEQVLLKALARDPTERYQSAATLAEDLRSADLSPPAVPVATRRSLAWIVLAASILALAAGAGALLAFQ